MPNLEEVEKAYKGEKIHPWRICAKGYQFRGGTTQVWQSDTKVRPKLGPEIMKCVKTSKKKDELQFMEMAIIATNHFIKLKGAPRSISLDFPHGNEFDWLIRGWVKYWNDVLRPTDPLDANLVKALIASESGFYPNPKHNRKVARGLMQLTERARKSLGDRKGELRDHLVVIPKTKITDPIANICGGIRWLFRKREIASSKLKRQATWEEAVANYKFYPMGPEGKKTIGMKVFLEKYGKLKK